MNPVKRNHLDTAWNPCLPQAGKIFWVCKNRQGSQRRRALVFLQTFNLMGDWCPQDGHYTLKRNHGIGREVGGSIGISWSVRKPRRLPDSEWATYRKRIGTKRSQKIIRKAAAPTSHLIAPSRSRNIYRKPLLDKRGLQNNGLSCSGDAFSS